jgi:ABC-type uncharacterized transport system involved in gliding motility auxiliary subunit
MKKSWRKFAPFSLLLAVFAVIAAIVLFIIQGNISLAVKISLALAVGGLAFFVLLDPMRIKSFLTGRQAKYGSNALIKSVAFIGILVAINYIVVNLAKSWDVTQDKQHTLSAETINVINKINQPIKVEAFYTFRYPTENTQALLDNYVANSNGKFTYKFVDPEKDPVAAQNAGVNKDATVVIYLGDQKEMVSFPSEQEVTSAIIRLQNPGERVVYFLTGHNERSLDQGDQSSYSIVKQTLEKKNYTVKSFDLISTPKVPEDARAVIIAGGTKPLSESEISILDQYVQSGGSLIALIDPPAVTNANLTDNPLVNYLKTTWGIEFNNDIIIDPNVNPPVVAVSDPKAYGAHPITEKLNGLLTLFPTSRSIQFKNNSSDQLTFTNLVVTSANAWGETDIKSLQTNQVTFDANSDHPGPVSIAVALENISKKNRILVAGDADFGSNGYFNSYGNGDLIINMIDYASKQDELINLTPKDVINRILVPPEQYQLGLLFIFLVILIPGIVLVLGISVWLQRRKKV